MLKTRHEDKRDDGTIVKRSVITFDSFNDLVEHNRTGKDYRSEHMDDYEFYGVHNLREACDLASKGLPKDGVEAINLAEHHVSQIAGDLYRPAFEDFHDTSGAFVDMGRYVEGEPECMISFSPTEEVGQNKIVSLILNITYSWVISAEAIKKNGQSLYALVEAIETCGMQAEIWLDMYVKGSNFRADDGARYRCRTAVRLKKAGEPFDVGMFMYALTHNSMLRAHIFNAMHSHDTDVRKACGIHPSGGYGNAIRDATDMDDFPPYSIYIPVISRDQDAGTFVPVVLKRLGLLK
ncbi:hypothetical protein KNU48_gp052 [Mycobacterium phage Silverleaf]|uniref:DUF7192 domain-containing protein n=1 Tax=Mycobacterium phage Silverleaf TaxID=2517969 RepID=A0A482JC25_9CAUD|nr:hypothetical protein KNU48_gp052 [Mycobacterium phage Silverleaf]QBP29192.1 hypothetical protein SEA_SILVERLEAF_118 [Mycobacterium phage Silverleaf]